MANVERAKVVMESIVKQRVVDGKVAWRLAGRVYDRVLLLRSATGRAVDGRGPGILLVRIRDGRRRKRNGVLCGIGGVGCEV